MTDTPAQKNNGQFSTVGLLFYRLPDIKRATGFGKTKIYDMIKAGEFPQPVQMGPRSVGWRPADLQAWADALPYQSKTEY